MSPFIEDGLADFLFFKIFFGEASISTRQTSKRFTRSLIQGAVTEAPSIPQGLRRRPSPHFRKEDLFEIALPVFFGAAVDANTGESAHEFTALVAPGHLICHDPPLFTGSAP